MIRHIYLQAGKSPDSAPLSFTPTSVTIFVGPNNSGKSLLLREIEDFCKHGQRRESLRVLTQIDFDALTADQAEIAIQSIKGQARPDENVPENHMIIEKKGHRIQAALPQLMRSLTASNEHKSDFAKFYAGIFTSRLDGHGRIDLVNQQSGGDLHQPPQNNLQFLFQNDKERARLRKIIEDAFGRYLVVDPTNLGKLRIRLADRPPEDPSEERGLDERAVQYHNSSQMIENASDGVKAFTGILLELIAGDPKTFLIDEPEAFLHPALSYKLGRQIAMIANSGKKHVFISTHSPHFVMGCVQSGVPVNIVRLTYRDSVATARQLAHDEIVQMMRNPLLRSANVLAGLFYESVVVTEADADRAFYQEINERLNFIRDYRGIPHCLFLNAQNKQTVNQIIRPLRKLGIPAAAIVDIDVIKEGGQVWTNFLSGGFVPEATQQGLAQNRGHLVRKIQQRAVDVKRLGVQNTPGEIREELGDLVNQVSGYGLFLVHVGELENWLAHLGIEGQKSTWLVRMFESMGEDPDSEGYLQPGEGDVWDFVGQVRTWLFDPARRGIPQD